MVRRFSKSHEWLDFDTETKQGKLGITKYAANALGDIVHVDLPSEGDTFAQGESIVSHSFVPFVLEIRFLIPLNCSAQSKASRRQRTSTCPVTVRSCVSTSSSKMNHNTSRSRRRKTDG